MEGVPVRDDGVCTFRVNSSTLTINGGGRVDENPTQRGRVLTLRRVETQSVCSTGRVGKVNPLPVGNKTKLTKNSSLFEVIVGVEAVGPLSDGQYTSGDSPKRDSYLHFLRCCGER